MRRLLLLAALLPAVALANVKRSAVTTQGISPASAARYFTVAPTSTYTTVVNGAVGNLYVPHAARLVDVILYQAAAGTTGTSYTIDVTSGGTSMLTTLPVITRASGVDILTDAKGALSLPGGWTRPVIKTDATAVVTKGARLVVNSVETGGYGTHASVMVILVFEPLN